MKVNAFLAVLLMLSVALAGCSGDDDADNDGVPDSVEERGASTFVYGMTEVVEIQVHSDPTKKDSDGDGLDDYIELLGRPLGGLLPTDPMDPDTDGDGLSDCQEFYEQAIEDDCPLMDGLFREYDVVAFETDALRADGDLAGPSRYNLYNINDGAGYLDRTGKDVIPSYTAIKGDGISDYDEIFGYDITQSNGNIIQGVTSDPNLVDTDGDGLEDGEEALLYGGDPRVEDTDGDGCLDGRDPFPDRVEAYGLEFSTFHFKGGEGFSGSAELVMIVNIADVVLASPTNGTHQVSPGETLAISSLSLEGLAPGSCTLTTPYRPWIKIQAVPHHRPDTAMGDNDEALVRGDLIPLDSWSDSVPEDVPVKGIWWNPREDVYRMERPVDPLAWNPETDDGLYGSNDPFITLEGPEGAVAFRATLSLS